MFKSILVGVLAGAVTAYWLAPDISPIEMYESGYKDGYREALYKRPVSDELEFVCAGLWVGKEDLKYQKREAEANARAATK